MTGYYAYFTGDDGHIAGRVTILAANDEEAKNRAQQLVDGHAVELWQEGRKVAPVADLEIFPISPVPRRWAFRFHGNSVRQSDPRI